jgi:CRP-like cAMP-binding protein
MPDNTPSIYDGLVLFLSRFFKLQEEDFSQLKKKIVYKEFPKKKLLIKEGETEQHLYFINKGLVHQYFYVGKEMTTTDLVHEGTITGSVASFLSGKPSHYFLETMEPTSVFIISKKDLHELYASDIKWQRFGRVLITHFLLQQEQHLLDNIRYSIRERIVHFAAAFPALLKRVPQRRLASYLNIKPETFSRLKSLTIHRENAIAPAKPNKKKHE